MRIAKPHTMTREASIRSPRKPAAMAAAARIQNESVPIPEAWMSLKPSASRDRSEKSSVALYPV